MNKDANCLLIANFTLIFLSIFSLFLSFVVWFIWNIFLSGVFGITPITWLQAFAATLLLGIITTVINSATNKDHV